MTQPHPSEIRDDQLLAAVDAFRLLAEPTRLRLLLVLCDGERSVNELAAAVERPAPTVSQHLAKLRAGNLVHTRRQGTHVFYGLADVHVRELVEDALFHADHVVGAIPDHGPTRDRGTAAAP